MEEWQSAGVLEWWSATLWCRNAAVVGTDVASLVQGAYVVHTAYVACVLNALWIPVCPICPVNYVSYVRCGSHAPYANNVRPVLYVRYVLRAPNVLNVSKILNISNGPIVLMPRLYPA